MSDTGTNDKAEGAKKAQLGSNDAAEKLLAMISPHRPEAKAEAKPESKPESKPEPKAEAKPASPDKPTLPSLRAGSLGTQGETNFSVSLSPVDKTLKGTQTENFKTGLVENLAGQVKGLETMLGGGNRTEEDRLLYAKYGYAPKNTSALSGLLHTAGTIAQNPGHIPGAIAESLKSTYKGVTSDDANERAKTWGGITGFGLTALIPIGGAAKTSTFTREASTFARGVSEVGLAKTAVGEYAGKALVTKIDDAAAVSARLPRIPTGLSSPVHFAPVESAVIPRFNIGANPAAKLANGADDAVREVGRVGQTEARLARGTQTGLEVSETAGKVVPPKIEAPAVKVEAPAVKIEAPVAKVEAPAVKVEAPAVKVEAPAVKVEAPLDTPAPVAKVEAPAAKVEAPLDTPAPVAKVEAPAAKVEAPLDTPAPVSRVEAPAARVETAPSAEPIAKPSVKPTAEPPIAAAAERTAPLEAAAKVEPTNVPANLGAKSGAEHTLGNLGDELADAAVEKLPVKGAERIAGTVDDIRPVHSEPSVKGDAPAIASSRFSEAIETRLPALNGAEKQLADDLLKDVKAFKEGNPDGLSLQALQEKLARPDVQKIFAENSTLARQFDQFGQSVKQAATRVDDALVNITESTAKVGRSSDELAKTLERGLQDLPQAQRGVAANLIEDLRKIKPEPVKLGANSAEQQLVGRLEQSSKVTRAIDDIASKPEYQAIFKDRPELARAFETLKQSGDQLALARIESAKVSVPTVERAIGKQAGLELADDLTRVSGRGGDLRTLIEKDLPAMTGKQRATAEEVLQNLRSVDEAVLRDTPSLASRRVEALVDDLSKPEFSRFFSTNPRYVEQLTELRRSVTRAGESRSVVESTALAGERTVVSSQVGEASVALNARLQTIGRELGEGSAKDLDEIARNLDSIARGGRTDRAIAAIRNSIDNIESQGSNRLTRDLRESVDDIEKLALKNDNLAKLEAASFTVNRSSAEVVRKAEVLAEELRPVAQVSPSKGSQLPVEAQISKHLDGIADQARLVNGSVDQVRTIANMRNSIARIEELGGAKVLTPTQAKAYEEIATAVRQLDNAAVEMRGLSRVREGATPIVERLPGQLDELRTNLGAAVKPGTDVPLRRVEEAVGDLKQARNLDESVAAVNRLKQELREPQLVRTLNDTPLDSPSRLAHNRLVEQVDKVDDALRMAQRERLISRLDGQTDNLVANLGRADKPALVDYSRAVKEIGRGGDDAIVRADQALAQLERESVRNPQLLPANTLQQIRQEHNLVTVTARQLDEVSTSLVSTRLERLRLGFNGIEDATSTLVQRKLIKENYETIQDLRYLETSRGRGAAQLEEAQLRLIRGANDIEVATYRSNLVKLASLGDKVALDRLLVSGLVPDGKKVLSLAGGEPGFIQTRALLLGFGKDGALTRNLSHLDPVFANNRSILLSPEVIGVAKYSVLSIYALQGLTELANRIDHQLLLEQYEALKRGGEESSESSSENSRVLPSRAGTDTNLSSFFGVREFSDAEIHRDLGGIAIQPFYQGKQSFAPAEGLSQSVMRQAFQPDSSGRVLPSSGVGNLGVPLAPPPERETGAFNLRVDDPEFHKKAANRATFGTDFAPPRKSVSFNPAYENDPSSLNSFARAQSLPFSLTYKGDRIDSRLDKPASSQFVIPSILNQSDFRVISGASNVRKDPFSANLGGSSLLGNTPSGQTNVKQTNDAGIFASALAGAAEGSSGHDSRNLSKLEESEDDVDTAGSGGVVVSSNNADDDDDDEQNAPASMPANAPSRKPLRVPQVPVSSAVASHDSEVLAEKAKASDSGAAAQIIAGPPRKRTVTA